VIINVITPVGDIKNLDKTIVSIERIAELNDNFHFKHILVFNNNVINKLKNKKKYNYELLALDINPISSRSEARNYGIENINFNKKSLVIFLDVGDILLSNPFSLIYKNFNNNFTNSIFRNKTICQIEGKKTYVPNYPLFLKSIVNPFMLSSIFISSDLLINMKFVNEKKEDWIFWYKILLNKPKIFNINKPSYIYKVDNLKKHYKNKYNSFLKLYQILYTYFKWGKPIIYIIILFHLILISSRWLLIRIKSV